MYSDFDKEIVRQVVVGKYFFVRKEVSESVRHLASAYVQLMEDYSKAIDALNAAAHNVLKKDEQLKQIAEILAVPPC